MSNNIKAQLGRNSVITGDKIRLFLWYFIELKLNILSEFYVYVKGLKYVNVKYAKSLDMFFLNWKDIKFEFFFFLSIEIL